MEYALCRNLLLETMNHIVLTCPFTPCICDTACMSYLVYMEGEKQANVLRVRGDIQMPNVGKYGLWCDAR
jgi:hypothetical protein